MVGVREEALGIDGTAGCMHANAARINATAEMLRTGHVESRTMGIGVFPFRFCPLGFVA